MLLLGHDSAINRDQSRYAWSYVMIKLEQSLYYLATTANSPGGTAIFWAEAGVGVMNFTLE